MKRMLEYFAESLSRMASWRLTTTTKGKEMFDTPFRQRNRWIESVG